MALDFFLFFLGVPFSLTPGGTVTDEQRKQSFLPESVEEVREDGAVLSVTGGFQWPSSDYSTGPPERSLP